MHTQRTQIPRPDRHPTHGLWDEPRSGRSGARKAFTLIEVLVVVFVIGLIAGILIVAVRTGMASARRNADGATARAIGIAIRQFEQEFGFPPPLVYDGLQGTAGAMTAPAFTANDNGVATAEPIAVPATNTSVRVASVYNPAYEGSRRFLEGIPGGTGAPSDSNLYERYDPNSEAFRLANQRYSKYSLGYYLAGAMPSAIDGVDGPGFVRPLADGSFQGVTVLVGNQGDGALSTDGSSTSRERYEPFFAPDSGTARIVREYFDPDEYAENSGNANATGDPAETDWRHAAIVDSNGKAFRYYRWRGLDPSYGITTSATYELNIPYVLVDDEAANALVNASGADRGTIDLTAGDAALRRARWAVVGAGPDGLFGTEPIQLLKARLPKPKFTDEDWGYRALAKSDNAVEVGE